MTKYKLMPSGTLYVDGKPVSISDPLPTSPELVPVYEPIVIYNQRIMVCDHDDGLCHGWSACLLV